MSARRGLGCIRGRHGRVSASLLALSLLALSAVACEQGPADKPPASTTGHALQNTAALQASLPTLGGLQPFALLDHAGNSFTAETMRGKVWVAAFMFTRCPTICPAMTRRMKALQQAANSSDVPLHLVSFSVDPDNDTPAVLSAYIAKNQVDTKTWSFVTGDSVVIREAAERGFKIGVEGQADPKAAGFGITHGSHLVLVDAGLNLRGYYQSSDPERVKQLLADAKALAGPSK